MHYSASSFTLAAAAILATFSTASTLPKRSGSAGCGKALPSGQSPPGGASHQVSFTQSNGRARSYLVHIPSNYKVNTPVPVIFSFHGRGGTGAKQERLSQFSNEAFNPNAIAVYPDGISNEWQGDPDSSGVDDIGFTNDMINHFSDIYCIDPKRIYAAGKSNGGGFTNVLACDPNLSKRIAAYAPVSGAYYTHDSADKCTGTFPQTVAITCNPGRNPIPIMEFHGSADPVIPYGGGARRGDCLPTIPHWVREWSKREGFGLTNKTTSLYNGNVLKYEYAGQAGKLGIVTHYLTKGLGHAWPSTQPNEDNSAGTYYNATPIIMDFFNKYTLPN